MKQEKDIEIGPIDPLDLFGPSDTRMRILRESFPKLKLIPRGTVIKALGEADEIDKLELVLDKMKRHYDRYNGITEAALMQMLDPQSSVKPVDDGDEVLVYGNSGLQVKARTPNQRLMVSAIREHDMLFAIGPAGTGKTYTAVALAVRALKNKEVRRIILTRPAVEAGENLGFLPGDLKEKLDPYLQPLYDALRDMIPAERLAEFLEQGVIQIAPLAFMRGRTLDNAYVILDEAQNATEAQIKMFLTRMGMSAKFIITGDPTQIDLPRHQPSGLRKAVRFLEGVEGISMVYLNEGDVIRHRLVKRIIDAFNKPESEQES